MKNLKHLFILFVIAGISLAFGSTVKGQSGHYSAASLGMGGTGTAYLDSYHANFMNPANLMLNSETKPAISLGILGGVSATAGGPLMNISVYNQYFTSGATVNANNVLNDWFGTEASNSRRLGMEVDLIPIGGSWRGDNLAISLAVRNRTLSSSSVNRGYAEVMLAGISQDRFGEPKPVNFKSEAVTFSEISAGVGIKLLEIPTLGFAENIKIYAGAAPKYILPHHASDFDFNSTLQVTDDQLIHDFQYTLQTVGNLRNQFQAYGEANKTENFDGSLGDFVEPQAMDFTSVQGSGVGVDVGGTIEMDLAGPAKQLFSWIKGPKTLRVGVSITDIGTITYDDNAGSFSANRTFTWEGVDFDDGFSEALTDSISQEIYMNYEPGSTDEIEKKLPAKFHFGSHLQLGKLAFALDLGKGLNEAGMNTQRVSMGLGAEYKLFGFLPLRAGYRTGGLTSSSITFGTGLELRNFELSFGALSVPNSENRGSGIGGAWSGLVFRF